MSNYHSKTNIHSSNPFYHDFIIDSKLIPNIPNPAIFLVSTSLFDIFYTNTTPPIYELPPNTIIYNFYPLKIN
jgi:hypothetical protein